MHRFQMILFPTDFSECAGNAFELACSLAKHHGARLLIAHVNDAEYGRHSFGGIMVEVRPEDYPARLLEQLKKLQCPYPEVPSLYVLVDGEPVEQILELAREHKCDLIVMGTHGRSGLLHLFLGSVAQQVVSQAPCPVVMLRQPPEPAPTPA